MDRRKFIHNLSKALELVEQYFNIKIVVNTMKNWLNGMLYTQKDVRSVVININFPINKVKRADYVSKLFDDRSSVKTIVWVDYTNFNLYCKRREGRSKVGTRPQGCPTF